jgi:hypothetical protein
MAEYNAEGGLHNGPAIIECVFIIAIIPECLFLFLLFVHFQLNCPLELTNALIIFLQLTQAGSQQ